MRRKQPVRLLLLVVLVATVGGVTLLSPASSAPVAFDQKTNRFVFTLLRPNLIRAEIVTFSAGKVGDYRVDRGVVRTTSGRLLTLIERDGTVVPVRLSPTTQISVDDMRVTARRVRPGMRATVMRSGNAAASWLYLTKRRPDKSEAQIRSLLSAGFVRAEVISWAGGSVLDSRADTGVIDSADNTSLTLRENDGTTVQVQIDSSTRVWVNNRASGAADLTAGMRTTTIGNGDGVASQIWAYGKKLGIGKR